MRIRSTLLVTTFNLLSFINTSFAAPVPVTENDIPIFKGAVRDQAAETERQKEFNGMNAVPEKLAGGQQTQTFRFYHTTAVVDEVFEFYRKTLDAKELDEDIDPFKLQPGKSTPITYSAFTYEDDEFEDAVDPDDKSLTYPGRELKKAYEKDKRKTFRGGRYLAEVQIGWSLRREDGELVNFIITVLDDSVRETEDPKTKAVSFKYERGTQIHFLRESYKEAASKK